MTGAKGRNPERTPHTGAAGSALEVQERRELVQRVAASPRFQRSPKLKDFLQFVCEHSLVEPVVAVHEQQIGHRVYGRRADYDTGEDNIVRVEARRLRKELEDYFALEGRGEPVVITIPKGGYVPVFRRRDDLVARPVPSARRFTGRVLWVASLTGVLVVALVLGWLVKWKRGNAGSASAHVAPAAGIWPLVLKPGERTFVVVADGSLAAVQDIAGVVIPMRDYVDRSYLGRLGRAELQDLARRQLTGMASLLFVSRIVHLNGGSLDNLFIRHPGSVGVRDFQSDNHILLGSRYSNPWVDLFREKRNFELVAAPRPRQPCYTNRLPHTGESASYCGDASSGEQYGVVAFLPNLSRTGSVLMLEGTTTEGTEATWQFLSSGQAFEDCVRRYRLTQTGGRMPYFELLLRARARGGAPVEFAYVTHRLVDTERR